MQVLTVLFIFLIIGFVLGGVAGAVIGFFIWLLANAIVLIGYALTK